ncbi:MULTISPECIES: hypothetical protein [Larsenimonas]|uniref:Uncharacterized protein n=1 Tax=Larsenimonas suaedae TaxID=1851019 RepID=A0ABU1GXF3_9GAMM|nr:MULTISPECIES: hypothetical protein [Larsenimonas]MCM2971482.1 hypothetical protein [Larsenimonas suaedae]MCM5703590.1 hypothetical protein [Larsenimonas salina]MDR5896738.1 hypothetical protein [Larsenimonas suaedae]
MSDTAILEIVELSNGEVVLRPSDSEDEALVSIRFSDDAIDMLRDSRFEIAREMIDHALTRSKLWENGEPSDDEELPSSTVH